MKRLLVVGIAAAAILIAGRRSHNAVRPTIGAILTQGRRESNCREFADRSSIRMLRI
jgi:hypothetical protein